MDSVLQSMVDEKIGPGERCQLLTQTFAEAVGCTSSTAFRTYYDCIRTALQINGAKEGTVVALSPLAPYAYKEVIEELKCKLVWVDSDKENGLPSEEAVASSGAEILILYENGGSLPLKYNSETTFAEKCDYSTVAVIEDVSESLGAKYRDDFKAGEWGKTVVCVMEEDSLVSAAGGSLLAVRGDMVYALRGHKPDVLKRMPDLNASLGIVQLQNLSENNIRRREIVKIYEQSLSKTKHRKFGLSLLDFENPSASFMVFLDRKPDEVLKFAQKREVPVRPSFENCAVKDFEGDMFEVFPVCAAYYYRTISFPVYPFLKSSEIDDINKVIAHLP